MYIMDIFLLTRILNLGKSIFKRNSGIDILQVYLGIFYVMRILDFGTVICDLTLDSINHL